MFRSWLVVSVGAIVGCAITAPGYSSATVPTDDQQRLELAQQMLQEAMRRYRELTSYRDESILNFEIEVDGEDPFGFGHMPEQRSSLAYQQPANFRFVTEYFEAYANGELFWIVMPMFGQYIQQDAPDSWPALFDSGHLDMLIQQSIHPAVIALAVTSEKRAGMVPRFKSVTSIDERELEGRRGREVVGGVDWPAISMVHAEPLRTTMWFDDETGLIGRMTIDMTDMYNAMMAQMAAFDDDDVLGERPEYRTFMLLVNFRDVSLNEQIPLDHFSYTPERFDERVEQFDFGFGHGDFSELVGQEAPDFTMPTLDGDELTLSSLRGRVVLLDFWATWCGPCVQAMPAVESLAEQFADRPVTILGVNRDQPGSEERLRRFVEERKITFRHVLDFEGTVAEAYSIMGYPSTVLIDAEGFVQDVAVGFPPGKEKDLAEKIERLLGGETLFDPEEIERRRAEIGEDGADAAPRAPRAPAAERRSRAEIAEYVAEALDGIGDRFVEQDSGARASIWVWNVQFLDVTGDGELEVVAPSARGNAMTIMKPDGSESRQLRLERPEGSAAIASFLVNHDAGEPRWLIVWNRRSRVAGSAATLTLHDNEGRQMWHYDIPASRDIFNAVEHLAAADLTGDGRIEYVAAAKFFQLKHDSRGGYWEHVGQVNMILLFDSDGKLLSQREVGTHVYQLQLLPAKDGQPGTIVVVAEGGLTRLQVGAALD